MIQKQCCGSECARVHSAQRASSKQGPPHRGLWRNNKKVWPFGRSARSWPSTLLVRSPLELLTSELFDRRGELKKARATSYFINSPENTNMVFLLPWYDRKRVVYAKSAQYRRISIVKREQVANFRLWGHIGHKRS